MAKSVVLYKVRADILDDSVLELGKYIDSVNSTYNLKEARTSLSKFSIKDNEWAGSNPFMLVHLANSGLLPAGSRLAGRKELETAVSLDNSFLRENYADFGLSLKSAGDSYAPNDLLAKILAEQLKKRGIELGEGKLIPLTALKNIQNSNSAYGLVCELNEQATKEDIKDLNDFEWDYERDKGIARAFLSRYLVLFSLSEYLADSDGSSRVVLASAEGTSQNFLEEQIAKLQKTRDREISEIREKYAEEEAILRRK